MSGPRDLLPARADYRGLARTWRADVVAGLTVAVVALPLALGFGITSGMGARAGLATAVIAGVVAAVMGGSHVQVSGPTGAMTVVLAPIVHRYGVDAVFTVGVLAGVLLVVASVVRIGRAMAFVPWPVIEGFTVGIGTIIFLQQVPAALGVRTPEGESPLAVAARAATHLRDADGGALVIVLVVVAIMVGAPRLHRSLPASLLAVGGATLLAEVSGFGVRRIGALPPGLPAPHVPAFSFSELHGLVGAALAVAALAAIESLLSAKVADGMSDVRRHHPDRELLGQGLANLVSPIFGGMPATGAIARTAVNVRAGGRTRVSAVIHALALLVVAVVGGAFVERIPLAALAAVLMVTAVRMVERHNVRAVVRATRSDAAVFAITAASTVAFDLVVAVEIGIAVAAVLALRQVALAGVATPVAAEEIDGDAERALLSERIVAYRLDGALFFGAAQRFLTELTNVTDARVVILRMPDLQVLDATGAQALGEIVAELEHRHITVLIKGLRAEHRRVLTAVGALEHLAHERHLFEHLDEAIAHARAHVGAVHSAL